MSNTNAKSLKLAVKMTGEVFVEKMAVIFEAPKCSKINVFRAPPRSSLGKLTALLQLPSSGRGLDVLSPKNRTPALGPSGSGPCLRESPVNAYSFNHWEPVT